MTALPAKIKEYFVDSVVEVFGHGDRQLQFEQTKEPDHFDLKSLPLAAMIGFKGEKLSGNVVLLCNAQILHSTNPIKDIPAGKEDAYARDWLGEIVNLILGQFKRKMVNHGFTFHVMPPSYQHYVRSSGMTLQEFGPGRYEEDGASEDFWFELGKMPLVVQLGLKLKAAFQ